MTQLSDTQLRLIDGWQREFPLHPAPYEQIAFQLGVSELSVLGMLCELSRKGVVSRVGAVVAPNAAGASTLAAMAVPLRRLDEVACIVSEEPGVNHNYEREHRFNLWFVVTGRDRDAIDAAMARITGRTGLDILDLPLRTAYHIDLGFPLAGAPRRARNGQAAGGQKESPAVVCPKDRELLCALENGLPLQPRPYAEIAARLGASEDAVLARLHDLVARGVIKRMGVIVRHRELGFRANAMVVWDIGDSAVDGMGETFARYPFVTLCYRRDRHRPHWPYNLFCMIHGRDRASVLTQVEQLRGHAADAPMDVLFSRRRFKQQGARFSAA